MTAALNRYIAIDDAAILQQPADVIRYRDETIQLVKEALLSDREVPSKPSSNPAIQSFWDIGTAIRSRGSRGQQSIYPSLPAMAVDKLLD